MTPPRTRFPAALLAGVALLAGAALAACAAPSTPPTAPARAEKAPPDVAAPPVSAPYFSLQLASIASEEIARHELQVHAWRPGARLERRGRFYAVRFGTWPTRAEAKAQLRSLEAEGIEAVVLRIENPVPWILPEGATAAPTSTRTPIAPAPIDPAPPPPTAGPAEPPGPPARTVDALLAETDEFVVAARALHEDVHRLLRTEGAARRDGNLYAMDVGPLMEYAARRGDQDLYLRLLPAARKLVRNRKDDPYTQGFVYWRHRDGEEPDVSGATEALRLARGLWAGAKRFNRAPDRALARMIVDGYEKHAFVIGSDWMVRKYFAFTSRIFSNLSVVTVYQPDFLAEVETSRTGADGPRLSERSYGMLERAVSDSGLLYPVIQPEINQTYPGLDLDVYAPNNILIVADSCDAAEGAVRGRPKIARGVLDFATDDDHSDDGGRLFAYFRAHDLRRVGSVSVGPSVYGCLAQLAAVLDDGGALRRLRPTLQLEMRSLAAVPKVQEAPLFVAGPLLLAAEAMGAFRQ